MRALTTLTLASNFVVIATSGVVLYVSPRGRTARWLDWRWLGLEKEDWLALHMAAAFVMLCVVGVHLYFNWRPLLNHVRGRAKDAFRLQRELGIAAASVLLVAALAAFRVPPVRFLVDANTALRDAWEQPVAPAPRALRAPAPAPAPALAPDTPTVEPPTPSTSSTTPEHDRGERRGLGRLSVAGYCTQEGIALETGLARLRAAGLDARADTLLRDLAGADRRPHDIAAVLSASSP